MEHSPIATALPWGERIIAQKLRRVRGGMAEIQKVPRADIKFIRGDDIPLYLHAARENILRYFVRQTVFQPGEKRRAHPVRRI